MHASRWVVQGSKFRHENAKNQSNERRRMRALREPADRRDGKTQEARRTETDL